MKKLYSEFFYVPKYGKVREKVMLMRTALTVVVMIVCLFAMSFTAYAYFSHSVTSGFNTIKAANFEAQITVNDGTNVVPLTAEGKIQSATLPGGTYTVTLAKGDSTAETGFCVITVGGKTYHTAQIGKDVARNLTDATVTFTLNVSAETKIEILSHWGTSSYYGYTNPEDPLYITAENYVIDLTTAASGVEEPSSNEEQGATNEGTGSETTTTEVTYTVKSGDTLSAIAKLYNVTDDQIAAYNGLEDKNKIKAGDVLKIPPADYVVPAETTTTETTTAPETTTTPETTTPAETTTPTETTSTEPVETTTSETAEATEPTDTTESSSSSEQTESQATEPGETTGETDTSADPAE